jgi:putative flippase GtrA
MLRRVRERLGGTGVEFVRFVSIGATSTIVDFIAYWCLLFVLDIQWAKAAGYVAGTAFSIFANYRWNFAYKGGNRLAVVAKCCVLYATALVLNVAVNSLFISLLGEERLALLVAFTAAVGLCTVYNFIGMKYLIFRNKALLQT